MLVLSRKRKQTLVIDGKITIEILQVNGNIIKLGITAPRDIRVLRGELHANEAGKPARRFESDARKTAANNKTRNERIAEEPASYGLSDSLPMTARAG
jgi:carbon storage regulator